MARIRIQMPDKKLGSVNIRVRVTDINYGNHLGNDALVGILHEARMQWLHRLGYTELNVEGVGLIMSDLAVEYKNESFYGDELTITLFSGDVSAVSFELYYAATNEDGKIIACAKTGMVCYNYELKKVAGLPTKFAELLA